MAIMGIDQYGQSYHDLGKHPRKALLERLGAFRANKMYVDGETGEKEGYIGPLHVGYIIKGLWITLYRVEPWAPHCKGNLA